MIFSRSSLFLRTRKERSHRTVKPPDDGSGCLPIIIVIVLYLIIKMAEALT